MNVVKLIRNLKSREIDAQYFETGEEAAQYLEKEIQRKQVVFGGSKTLESLGLYEKLEKNNQIFWHWKNPDAAARRQAEFDCEVYISSANGMAETGEIINIDTNGNRIANTVYCKDTVYFIVGRNKVHKDLGSALSYARNVAAPNNAKRSSPATPAWLTANAMTAETKIEYAVP